MGCLAIIKGSNYNEFVMSVDILARDNDGIGIVFGYSASTTRYQVHMINDRWPEPAADDVPGAHMKLKVRNSQNCAAEQDSSNVCFDTLAYVASDELRKDPHVYPENKLASMDYIPEPYSPTYHAYGDTLTLTLLVKDKQARAFFTAKDGARVGVWADLLPTYTGGSVQCRNQFLDFIFYFLTVASCVLEVVIMLVETKKFFGFFLIFFLNLFSDFSFNFFSK